MIFKLNRKAAIGMTFMAALQFLTSVQAQEFQQPQSDPPILASKTRNPTNLMELAARGNSDSGGGLAVNTLAGLLFYDLWKVNPNLKDSPSEFKIRASKSSQIIGFDRFSNHEPDIKATQEYQLALSRLELWSHHSPVMMNLIKETMSRTTWLYTPYRLGLHSSAEKLIVPSTRPVEQAIIYYSQLGAVISLPVWDSLGVQSRAAGFIHETLRQIQLRYGDARTKSPSFSDDYLIELTAAVILSEPGQQPTFDDVERVDGNAKSMIENSQRLQISQSTRRTNIAEFKQIATTLDRINLEIEEGSESALAFSKSSNDLQSALDQLIQPGFVVTEDFGVELQTQLKTFVGRLLGYSPTYEKAIIQYKTASEKKRSDYLSKNKNIDFRNLYKRLDYLATFLILDIGLIETERAIQSMEKRRANLVDLTVDIKNVIPDFGEQRVRDYIAGTYNPSFSELLTLNRIIGALKANIQNMKKEGLILD